MQSSKEVPTKLLYAIARNHHGLLPESVRSFIDPEDLVSEAMVRIVESGESYDSTRGGFPTFCGAITTNTCLKMAAHHRYQKRFCFQTSLEEIHYELRGERPSHELGATAERRLNRFFRLASFNVLHFFHVYYFSGRRRFKNDRNRDYAIVAKEIEWLVARTGVTADDFRYARAASIRLFV